MTPSKNKLLLLGVVLTMLFAPFGHAMGQSTDTIDRADDFVIASLVVADPGSVLYSRVGHVGLHMECPDYNLFVSTYLLQLPDKSVLEQFILNNKQ